MVLSKKVDRERHVEKGMPKIVRSEKDMLA